MKRIQQLLSAALVVSLAACGGGGSSAGAGSPLPQTTAAPNGGVTIPSSNAKVGNATAMATVSAGFPLKKSNLRKAALSKSNAYTISSVEVDGTIYPGTASAVPVTNKVTLTPSNGTISINMPFSNVPAGNNEWMVLSLLGIAPDGSKFDLGQLASLVNVSQNQVTPVTLNAASTQTFEVFAALAAQNVFSSLDLQDATLGAKLATAIAGAGQTPDSATQLYTPLQLNAIANAIAPAYARNLTLSTSTPLTNGGRFYVVADYTNAAENNLQANRNSLWNFPLTTTGFGPSAITPCPIQTTEPVGPGTVPVPSTNNISNCSSSYDASSGTVTIQNVYGGPLKAGVTNYYAPYVGAWTSLAGVPSGQTPTTITLTPASTDVQVTVNDPAGWALPGWYGCRSGQNCGYSVSTVAGYLNAFRPNLRPTNQNMSVPSAGYDATHNIIDVNAWGTVGEDLSGLQLCPSNLDNACTTLNTITPTTTLQVKRLFADSFENLSYYNWQGSTGITTAQGYHYCTASPSGIVIGTGGASAGSITTTTPTYLGASGTTTQIFVQGYNVYSGANCTGTQYSALYAAKATWTITATDSNGNTYTGSYTNNGYSGFGIPMPTITKTVQITKMMLSFSVPSGTTPPATGWGIWRVYGNLNSNGGFGG